MNKWAHGTILRCLGQLHFKIFYNGTVVRRQQDQLRPTQVPAEKDNAEGTQYWKTPVQRRPPVLPPLEEPVAEHPDEAPTPLLQRSQCN